MRLDVTAYASGLGRSGLALISGRWCSGPVGGALGPAGWAARSRTAFALRAE